MSTLVLLSILLGALLGMRFKVFVLIPAIAFALIVILGYGTAFRIGLSGIFLAIAVASSCLQIGYIFSIIARYGIIIARAGRPRNASTFR